MAVAFMGAILRQLPDIIMAAGGAAAMAVARAGRASYEVPTRKLK
jgi:hypothetical protein